MERVVKNWNTQVQGSGGVTIHGRILKMCRCGTWGHGLLMGLGSTGLD